MNRLGRFDTIELFGTCIEGDDYGFLFAPEDDEARAFWLSSNVASWTPDGDIPGQGVASMPRWIARKRKCIDEPPDDEDPAWLDIARLPRKYFAARWIKVGEILPKP